MPSSERQAVLGSRDLLDYEAEGTRIFRNVDNCFVFDMALLARTLEIFRNVHTKTSNLASIALFGGFHGVNFSRDVVFISMHVD
jgi:hypothetical protein